MTTPSILIKCPDVLATFMIGSSTTKAIESNNAIFLNDVKAIYFKNNEIITSNGI